MFTPVGFITVLTSFIGFSQLNNCLQYGWIPVPKKYVGTGQEHKWRNTVGSLIHAAVVGTLAALSVPYLWSDLVKNYTQLGELTLAIALGYMIYDMIDLLKKKPFSQVWPLVIHHFLVGYGCFILIWRQEYLGYGVFCSTAEINSVSLHLRQLLLMYDVTKTSTFYKINNVFNIVTYVFLRIPIFILIPIFLVNDRDRMVSYWNTIMFLGDIVLLVINLVLFKRLIHNDFFRQDKANKNLMDL